MLSELTHSGFAASPGFQYQPVGVKKDRFDSNERSIKPLISRRFCLPHSALVSSGPLALSPKCAIFPTTLCHSALPGLTCCHRWVWVQKGAQEQLTQDDYGLVPRNMTHAFWTLASRLLGRLLAPLFLVTSSNLAYNELHLSDPTGIPLLFYLVGL